MGKVVEQNLWRSAQNKECGKCGMDKSEQADNGCCKDERKQLKVETDHFKSAANFEAMQLASVMLPVSVIKIPGLSLASIAEDNPNSHAPPRSFNIAVYKRNCVFRI
jgi:hypothetical protein